MIAFRMGLLLLVVHRREAADPAEVDGAGDDLANLIEIQRLEQVLEGAQRHGLDGGLGGAVGA